MTLHGMDLIAIALMIAAGFASCYALLLRKLRATLTDRQMKIADQLAVLDDAIHVLEQHLAEQKAQPGFPDLSTDQGFKDRSASEQADIAQEENQEHAEIAPEIRAVVAAAAVAAAGPNAVVHSVKPATSPWTQQGRVLVQGGHNLRVQR